PRFRHQVDGRDPRRAAGREGPHRLAHADRRGARRPRPGHAAGLSEPDPSSPAEPPPRPGAPPSPPRPSRPAARPAAARPCAAGRAEQRLAYVRAALKQAPDGPPEQKMFYSNNDYVVAGLMLETVGVAPWETLIAREVFEPLGVRNFGFGPPGVPGSLDQPQG